MIILFLFIVLWQGDIRHKVIEFSDWTECREWKTTEETWAEKNKAQVIRSECFDVGQVVNK